MMVFDAANSHELLMLSVIVFGFVHKRIGRALRGAVKVAADFIPGGGTALKIVDVGYNVVKPGGGGGRASVDLPAFNSPVLLSRFTPPPSGGGGRPPSPPIPFYRPNFPAAAPKRVKTSLFDLRGDPRPNGPVVLDDPTDAWLNRAAAIDSKTGLPLWGDMEIVDRIKCPRGYVAVEQARGGRGCMLKGAAIALSKWKQRKKPIISVRDYRAFQRSTSVVNKLENIAKKVVEFKAKKKVTRK